jgi:hypothetical protein
MPPATVNSPVWFVPLRGCSSHSGENSRKVLQLFLCPGHVQPHRELIIKHGARLGKLPLSEGGQGDDG